MSSAGHRGVRNATYAGEMNDELATETEAAIAPAPAEEYLVFLRLVDGERIEAGSFGEEGEAHSFAGQFMAAASPGMTRWPRVGDRYLRPETIAEIDVERSNQPRWTGSTGRASTWGQQGAA